VIAIAAGDFHSLAFKSDGTVVAWGQNRYGEGAVPPGPTGVVAIAAGRNHSVALRSDGTVFTWGDMWADMAIGPRIPAGLNGVTAIAAGERHALALRNDGTVVRWGDLRSSVPAGLDDAVAIAAGPFHGLAVRSDGTVVAWGANESGQTAVPAGLSGVTAVAAGGSYPDPVIPLDVGSSSRARGSHSLALRGDGTVVAWGDDEYGQAAVPAGLSGVTAIAAGV
jgi:alpha-tubulin suppressor-like RCC1 family protein